MSRSAILTEGREDRYLFGALLTYLFPGARFNPEFENVRHEKQPIEVVINAGNRIDLHAYGGVSNMRAGIENIIKEPVYTRILVTADEDNSRKTRFNEISQLLSELGFNPPHHEGHFVSRTATSSPQLAVQIIAPRTLEGLVWETLKANQRAACVERYMQCLDDANFGIRGKNALKARIRAYLAPVEHNGDVRLWLGNALLESAKGSLPLIDFNHEIFTPLFGALRQLKED
jgi:hypothetical protein